MAFSKPIIATGVSDFFVKPNVNGYLIEPNNIEAMKNSLIELINDKEKRESFGNKSYEIVKEKSDITNYGKVIYNLYKEILNEK